MQNNMPTDIDNDGETMPAGSDNDTETVPSGNDNNDAKHMPNRYVPTNASVALNDCGPLEANSETADEKPDEFDYISDPGKCSAS